MSNPNSNAASIAVETVSRNMLASDPNRAAYFWMVRDATNIATLPIDSLPVLVAEYDSSGQLHLLSEVVAPPPYVAPKKRGRPPGKTAPSATKEAATLVTV